MRADRCHITHIQVYAKGCGASTTKQVAGFDPREMWRVDNMKARAMNYAACISFYLLRIFCGKIRGTVLIFPAVTDKILVEKNLHRNGRMKQSIYLDTSVLSAYFDDRIPYQRDITRQWWRPALREYEVFVSELTLDELGAAGEPKRADFLSLVADIASLAATEEVLELGERYVEAGIMPARYGADALHIAYATLYKIDFLVTWNCAHLANVKKIQAVSLFNTSTGLAVARIVTPEFFVPEEETE